MNAPSRSPTEGGRSKPPLDLAAEHRVRVMIVDDSLTVRTVFRRMVEGDPAMEIIGTASSGERAIAQIKRDPADVVLLDLEMPGMGGLKALPELLEASRGTQVLVVSSLTQDGAEATVAALSSGAADTLQKPRPGGFNEEYRNQLLGKIHALGRTKSDFDRATPTVTPAERPGADVAGKSAQFRSAGHRAAKRPEVIAIGASTGGIHALNLMLKELSPACSLPILITQHLPDNFIPVFARQVEVTSGRITHVAKDGLEVRPGEIVIANGQGHMSLKQVAGRLLVETLADPVPSGCLPSVDPMLSSLAKSCEGRALAIVLSGMGRDGAEGAQELVAAGGTVWAQNADTCAVWGMPGAVAKAGLTTLVADPKQIGRTIMAKFSTHGSAIIKDEAS